MSDAEPYRHPAAPYLADLIAHAEDAFTRTSDPSEWISLLYEATMLEHNARQAARAIAVEARRRGATWDEIGTYFRISRQAAHQRFGPHV